MRKRAELPNNLQLVLAVLEEKGHPMSAYMILDQLHGSSVRAPLQVYRALEKLISMGQVHRLESLNSFIACNDTSCATVGVTAFVICEKCEQVQEVSDNSVSLFITELAEKAKITAIKSSIELHGICGACENA